MRRIFYMVKWADPEKKFPIKGSRREVKDPEKMKEYLAIGYSIERVELIQTRGEKKLEQVKEEAFEQDRILF